MKWGRSRIGDKVIFRKSRSLLQEDKVSVGIIIAEKRKKIVIESDGTLYIRDIDDVFELSIKGELLYETTK